MGMRGLWSVVGFSRLRSSRGELCSTGALLHVGQRFYERGWSSWRNGVGLFRVLDMLNGLVRHTGSSLRVKPVP